MPISHHKTSRTMAQAAVGRFPASREAMMDRIPLEVRRTLPAQELAALLDAVWGACQEAKAIATREAIADGCLWDHRRARLIEIESHP